MHYLFIVHAIGLVLSGIFMLAGVYPSSVSHESSARKVRHFLIGVGILIVVVNSGAFFLARLPK